MRRTPRPNKYEKLIDSLLARPQYGERWGRHWLDVVRYGEDNPGNITNPPYPHAWRYRDWVIDALNKDVPYDRFVKMQLAADLMPGTSRPDLRALGPIALGPQDHKDVRLSIDVDRHAAVERLGRAPRHRHARPARVVGVMRALPRSQVRSDPADGLRAAHQRVRVDVALRCARSSRSIRRPKRVSCGCISGCSTSTTRRTCSKVIRVRSRSRRSGRSGSSAKS